MNPGIINYQSFCKVFSSLIKSNRVTIKDNIILINSDYIEIDRVLLRLTDVRIYLNIYDNTAKLTLKNENLEKKLKKV